MTIRRVDRDVKAVHGDVQVLLVGGVLDGAHSGRVMFPYDGARGFHLTQGGLMSTKPKKALHRSFTDFFQPENRSKISALQSFQFSKR